MRPYVGRLVTLDVLIGDRSALMLFDTGAGVTAITPGLTEALDCTPHGRLVGHRMSGERVEFEKCGVQSISLGRYKSVADTYVFDLMALLPEGLPDLGGIISLASVMQKPVTLDLAGQKLIFETKASFNERIKDAQETKVRLKRGPGGEVTAFVRIEAETGDLWFLLDSGNLDHVAVAPHTLDQLGVIDADSAPVELGTVIDLDFQIAGAYAVSAKTRVNNIIYDGALNEKVMRSFLITFDLESERIWFSRVADKPSPGAGQ